MEKDFIPFFERAKKEYDLKELERLGLTPTLEQRDQILLFMALLLKWNKVSGLISPKDEEGIFIRHFCDSLQPLLLFGFKKNARVLDIGAGGGFPAIPTAIFRPDLSIVMAESNRKKTSFLKEVLARTGLGGSVTIFAGRIEKMDVPEKGFDYIMSRGVGSMEEYSALALPFAGPDGHLYTFKSKHFTEELEAITLNKDKNGIKIREIAEYDLGNQIHGLNLVSLEKV